MFLIDEILSIVDGSLYNENNNNNNNNNKINTVEFDSRKVSIGTLFIALTGGVTDGHNYLLDAKEKGAVCALISKPVEKSNLTDFTLILVEDTEQALRKIAIAYRDKLNIPIIAITGSSGKTSTKDSIASVLSYKYNVYKTFKNYNNHLGLPLSILQIKPEHEVAVLEMGMNHYGEIDLIASIARPTISVIINIGEAHIENLGSRKGIADAKSELIPHTQNSGFVLLNQDDDFFNYIKDKSSVDVYSYSIQTNADISSTNIKTSDRGTTFSLHYEEEKSDMFIPLFGMHHVSNILSASFIAKKFGFSIDELRESLKNIQISEMRFQIIDTPEDGVLINDAYNANPASMRASIETFSSIFKTRKKVLVLGDMFELGNESHSIHYSLGEFMNQFPDFTVFTIGENSRFISEAFIGDSKHFDDVSELVETLKLFNNEENVIFFKASRGMRLENIINSI